MITPSFSLTATERVLPKLALDFTTASLDPRVTFTRSLNTATVINSFGNIEMANANVPRFDYTYGTGGSCKGLLIEESRTNSLTYSDFSGAIAGSPPTPPTNWSWSGGGGSMAISTDSLGGNILSFTGSAQRPFISISLAVSANTTYTFSIYCESNSSALLAQQILTNSANPAGATSTYYANGVAISIGTYRPVANDRLSVVIVVGATAGNSTFRVGVGTSSNSTGTAAFSKPQFETGAFPTSYIPTATTTLTRNADVATMTGTNFSDWFNQSEGTWYAEATWASSFNPPATNLPRLFIASNGTSTNRHDFLIDTGSSNILVYVGSDVTTQWFLSRPTSVVGKTIKAVGAYALNNVGYAMDASVPVTDTAATMPSPDRLNIGSFYTLDSRYFMNGWVKKLNYWPQRLTNAEVQAFSK